MGKSVQIINEHIKIARVEADVSQFKNIKIKNTQQHQRN